MSNEEPPATTVRREEPTVVTPTPDETTTVPETQEFSTVDLEEASEEVFTEDMVPASESESEGES